MRIIGTPTNAEMTIRSQLIAYEVIKMFMETLDFNCNEIKELFQESEVQSFAEPSMSELEGKGVISESSTPSGESASPTSTLVRENTQNMNMLPLT